MANNAPSFIVVGTEYLVTTVNGAQVAVTCTRIDEKDPRWIVVEPANGDPYALNLDNVLSIKMAEGGKRSVYEQGTI